MGGARQWQSHLAPTPAQCQPVTGQFCKPIAGHIGALMRLQEQRADTTVLQRYVELLQHAGYPSVSSRPRSAGARRPQSAPPGRPQAARIEAARSQAATLSGPQSATVLRPRPLSATDRPSPYPAAERDATPVQRSRPQSAAPGGRSKAASRSSGGTPASAPLRKSPGKGKFLAPSLRWAPSGDLSTLRLRTNVNQLRKNLDASYAPSSLSLRNNVTNLKKKMLIEKSMSEQRSRAHSADCKTDLTKKSQKVRGEHPVFKDQLWKLNSNGSVDEDKHWLRRRFYLFQSGDLCYKSIKNENISVATFLNCADLCNAEVLPLQNAVKPFAFEIRLRGASGDQTISRSLAATSKAKLQMWMKLLEGIGTMDPRHLKNIVEEESMAQMEKMASVKSLKEGRRKSKLGMMLDPLQTLITADENSGMQDGKMQIRNPRRMSTVLTSMSWKPSPNASRARSVTSEDSDGNPLGKGEDSASSLMSSTFDDAEVAHLHDERWASLLQDMATKRKQRQTAVFRRFQDESEVHRDCMHQALDLLGFQNPSEEIIDEVFTTLTTYNTIDHIEMGKFVTMFEERQLQDYLEHFNQYVDNRPGMVWKSDLPSILQSCRISFASTALPELTAEACDCAAGGVSSDNFTRLVMLLFSREGFSQKQLVDLRKVFKRFDRTGKSKMATEDLFTALTYLDYPADYFPVVKAIGDRVDVSSSPEPTGYLSEWDFVVCARKVCEHDDVRIAEYIEECDIDASGTIDRDELLLVLRHLGYMPDTDAIDEALDDAGLCVVQDLSFSELHIFLQMFRKREGLTRAEVDEIDTSFDRYDRDGSGEISSYEVGKLLRWMGYLTSFDLQQKLVREVDVDLSGRLDRAEVRKLVRKYREREIASMKKAFEDGDDESEGILSKKNCVEILHRMGVVVDREDLKIDDGAESEDSDFDEDDPDNGFNVYEFVQAATRVRQLARSSYRKNAGYTPEEVVELEVSFAKYDANHSGDIRAEEVRVLLEDLFPELATSSKSRPHLLKILREADEDGNDGLDFQEFLRMMRQFHDLQDRDRLLREQQAIQSTMFDSKEVEEFRELFMGTEEDEVRTKLTFQDLQRMIAAICPLRAKHVEDLRDIFLQTCSEEGDETKMVAHFPEFLLIFRKLLDLNFADIVSRTATQPIESRRGTIMRSATGLSSKSSRSTLRRGTSTRSLKSQKSSRSHITRSKSNVSSATTATHRTSRANSCARDKKRADRRRSALVCSLAELVVPVDQSSHGSPQSSPQMIDSSHFPDLHY